MSAEAVFGIVFGSATFVAVILTVFRPRWSAWRAGRAEHREAQEKVELLEETGVLDKIRFLVDGKPEVRDAADNVVEHAVPSLPIILARLDARTRQLITNGGAHLADDVKRTAKKVDEIDLKFDQRHTENARRLVALEVTATSNADRIEEARRLAADVAMLTARNEDRHRGDHERLEEAVRELWQLMAERLDAAETRVAAYTAVLQELGIDVDVPAPAEPPRYPPFLIPPDERTHHAD